MRSDARRAAAAEVRLELGAAKRETSEALREAMAEVRAALSEIWGPRTRPDLGRPERGRMSRAQRKEMTRELLLDAAIEVFAEKGYHGASLDDVADAAGFTKGAVYSNFTRKSDLFRALLERESSRYDQALSRPWRLCRWSCCRMSPPSCWPRPRRTSRRGRCWSSSGWPPFGTPASAPRCCNTTELVGEAFEAKLQDSELEPGFDGRELAVLFDALVTGLLMNRALAPDGDQPALLARALRKSAELQPPRPPAPSGKPEHRQHLPLVGHGHHLRRRVAEPSVEALVRRSSGSDQRMVSR